MIDRLVSYLFTFLLLLSFVLFAPSTDQNRILLALGLAVIVVFLAVLLNLLTVDGAGSAIIIGTVAFGLGNWTGAYAILFFFLGTHLVTKLVYRKETPDFFDKRYSDRRDGSQVWSNGFVFTLLLFFWYITGLEIMLFVAMGSLAAALSDTWASEVGESLSSESARMITTFRKVPAGTDGAISVQGTLAAMGGAFLFSVGFVLLEGLLWNWIVLVAITMGGFLGCVMDSYLGALFQSNNNEKSSYITLTNNSVNALATVFGALITFLILQFSHYGMV